jgi:hypothetical protein
VDENWTTDKLPPIIGQTEKISGIFAHSNWVSTDKRYLFCFDEGNEVDIAVHDISDPKHPKLIGTFQYSGEADYDAVPHNGEIRGQYLYVAYYTAGLRVFDISNPFQPYEVGHAETYRDPDGDGVMDRTSLKNKYEGAWNAYPYLPSGNVLLSDRNSGLFVVKQIAPYYSPERFTVSAHLDTSGYCILSWSPATNARGYSVLRSNSTIGPFEQIAEHLIEESYTDTTSLQMNYYKIVAINAEGRRVSLVISSTGVTIPRQSKAGKRNR